MNKFMVNLTSVIAQLTLCGLLLGMFLTWREVSLANDNIVHVSEQFVLVCKYLFLAVGSIAGITKIADVFGEKQDAVSKKPPEA